MNEPLLISGRLRSSAILGGREFVCDGVSANLVHEGGNRWRLCGIRPPTTDPTASNSSSAGSVTAGSHVLAVTFGIQRAGVVAFESSANPNLVTVTAAGSKKLALAALPISDNDDVTCRVVYLTAAGGTVLYRAAVIDNNTAATYDLDIADAALTAGLTYSYGNGFIPAKPLVQALNGHLVFAGDVPYKTGTAAVTQGSDEVSLSIASAGVPYTAEAQTGRVYWAAETDLDIHGVDTTFDTEYQAGDEIEIEGEIRTIASVDSATLLTLTAPIGLAPVTHMLVRHALVSRAPYTTEVMAGQVTWNREDQYFITGFGGAQFDVDYQAGDEILILGAIRRIATVDSATRLTLTQPIGLPPLFGGGVAHARVTRAGSGGVTDVTRAWEGKYFAVPGDGAAYLITAVDEATLTLTLAADYAGATNSAAAFAITGEASTLYRTNVLPYSIEGLAQNTAGTGPAADQTIDVGRDDGQPITLLGLRRGSLSADRALNDLVVGKTHSLYLVTGLPGQYNVLQISASLGAPSHWAGAQLDNGDFVWYAGRAGVYLLRSNEPQKLSPPELDPWFADEVNHDLDHRSHLTWDPDRRRLYLWVARAGEATVLDKVLVADFARVGTDEETPLTWWEWRVPARLSRYIATANGGHVLISGDHGEVWALDTAASDGADAAARRTVAVTAVGEDEDGHPYLDVDSLELDAGAVSLQGARVRVLTGAAAGQERFVLAATNTRLTLDNRAAYGGDLDPAPSAGDRVVLGGIPSRWTMPVTLAAPAVQKVVDRLTLDFDSADSPVRWSQMVEVAGRWQYRGASWLPAQARRVLSVPVDTRAPRAQHTLSMEDGEWALRGAQLTATGAGEVGE